MPDISKEEQQILTNTEVKFRVANHQGNTKEELTPLETKILDALRTEFDASPGNTTPDKIREVAQAAIDEAPGETQKKKGGFGKFLDKAAKVAKDNVQTVRVDVGGVRAGLPNLNGKPKQAAGNSVTADDIAKIAEDTYSAAGNEKAEGSAKTIEDVIKETAVGGVLKSTDVSKLLQNPKFVALAKGQEVAVDNQPKHDNDEITIGGAKGKHINLSDLGVTINDSTSAGGFPAGKTVIQKGR